MRAAVIHSAEPVVLDHRVVEADVALPRRVVLYGDLARLRPVEGQLGAVQAFEQVIVQQQLAAPADIYGFHLFFLPFA